MNKKIVSMVVGFIIIASVAFYAGTKFAAAKGLSISQKGIQDRTGQMPGNFGGARNMKNGGGFTMGEILSKDAQSITVKLRDGGSKIIFLGEKVSIVKTVDGTADDLVVGKNVTISGTANPDGSLMAESIQIRTAPPVLPSVQ